MNYQAFIFDFDYTLGDSTKGIVLSANDGLERLGLQMPPDWWTGLWGPRT